MISWFRRLFSLFCLVLSVAAAAENRVVTLGTGGVTGLYYPTGGAFCRLANLTRNQHGMRCSVRSTPGSVANLKEVSEGQLDFGIAEAGQLHDAYTGKGEFSKPDRSLRSLFSIFPEYITVISRADSGIEAFSDLKGKRINIGQPGSSQHLTLRALFDAFDWQFDQFSEIHELEPAGQADALCENRIDATLYVVGHPSGAIKEALRDCNSRLISLSTKEIKALTSLNPHYYPRQLRSRYYSPELSSIDTVSVDATLFASTAMSEEVVYAMVKSLFEQFGQFKRMHPAFWELEKQQMVPEKLAAPLHAGAERYYREIGLIK